MTHDYEHFFADFIEARHPSMKSYYSEKISQICCMLYDHKVSCDELFEHCFLDNSSNGYYSLFELIVDGLCPPVAFLERRIREMRKSQKENQDVRLIQPT